MRGASQVLGYFPELVDRGATLRTGFLCRAVEAVVKVVTDQAALGFCQCALDRMQLLRDVEARTLCLDHRSDAPNMAFDPAQPLDDRWVGRVCALQHSLILSPWWGYDNRSRTPDVPPSRRPDLPFTLPSWLALAAIIVSALLPVGAFAHGVASGDAGYIQEVSGFQPIPFAYLGAKHMVTGYDHLLFLLGVVFFLYRLRDVGLYVTLFAVGHSITLLLGVLGDIAVSPYLIDAVIGLSVVYKALDNLGAYRRWFGVQPDPKAATFLFGLFHGFGLATKIQDFEIAPDGLVANLIAFNVGVEIGQVLALVAILVVMGWWRRTPGFSRHAYAANVWMMGAGFLLTFWQLSGFFLA